MVKIEVVTCRVTTTIPEKGHPAMLKVEGEVLTPQPSFLSAFPILPVSNLLVHAVKVDLGLVIRLASQRINS